MKRAVLFAITASAHLAGCATLSADDCRGTSWYSLGWRDGAVSWYRSIGQYAAQCAPFGIQPDAAQYGKGWEDAQWYKAQRTY